MSTTDRLVLVAAVLAVIGSYAWLWRPGDDGTTALVWVDGERATELSLQGSGTHQVEGRLGTTVLEYEPGRVRVRQSPGERRLCVRQGWLEHTGETAVCLPNRVVVEVTGNGEQRFDAISQ